MCQYSDDIYGVYSCAHNLLLHNPPLNRRCVASLDSVRVSSVTDHFEEGIVSCVPHPVVPQPDVAHNDVNGRLVESVAARVLFVSVSKSAGRIVTWHETVGVLRTSHPPPQNVAENLVKHTNIHTHLFVFLPL